MERIHRKEESLILKTFDSILVRIELKTAQAADGQEVLEFCLLFAYNGYGLSTW